MLVGVNVRIPQVVVGRSDVAGTRNGRRSDRVQPVAISGTAVAPTLEQPGCTSDPVTPGGPRRLCFGLGTERSFTLRSVDGPIPVSLGVPPGHTLLAPASPRFVVSMVPTTVTLRAMPFVAGFLVINREDGGMPVRIELTNSCTLPSGCS